ncbi:hypothetical protein BJD55_gp117 [Gordonia phage Yvonnetastic]|uniref:Uncharacterized protein n=1 Tax=Gordonia phage Yvonnetastic TaxID=1821566 RepID=A0A142K966_9CAUD|nr:hypothetical protein BJD55_gp117 [Gordonia phage Yvonnetastic]AMS02649.1 hypothetical protein SEA_YVONNETASTIC_105 [Gordonia phage Yvonnetastic]
MTATDLETVSVTELEEMVNNQLQCEVRHYIGDYGYTQCEQPAAWSVTKSCCRKRVYLCNNDYQYVSYSDGSFDCLRCDISHDPARRIIASSRKI